MARVPESESESRRFLRLLLLVTSAVLGIGLVASLLLLQRVERELLAGQAKMSEREAAIIARFIERDLAAGATREEAVARLQSVLHGTGASAEFLCLLDENGRVLSHPDPAMVGMERGRVAVSPLAGSEAATIGGVLAARRSVAVVLREAEAPVQLVHYEPVSGEEWTLAVHKNAAAIAGQFAALRWQLLGAAVPTLLLISLVGVVLARSMGRRFERELEDKNEELEQRVRERTTELTRTLGELQAAHERLLKGEKMHLLGELMAGIAHEINNPLTAIGGYAELLEQGIATDARKLGGIIVQQTRRVASIVRNLLNFAHNRPAERRSGSLAGVLRSAEELVAAELRRAGVVLESRISPELPPMLIDAQQIEQVFINLLRNSAQALAKQPGERRIRISAFTDGLWVSVQIRDNGPGVPAELRENIFESFVTTKSEGTGLGLSLCRRFVEAHGGCIELCTDDLTGPGACFNLRLPASGQRTTAPVAAIAAAT